MTDLESAVRAVIARRLQLARVPGDQRLDDEAVAAIMQAAGDAVITDGLAAAVADQGRGDGMQQLAAEVIGAFKRSPNGWNARAKLEMMDDWKERLGAAG